MTQQLLASRTKPPNVNNHVQWKYGSFGFVVRSHKICTHLHGIQDRKIWQIISANITWDIIMKLSDPGVYIWKTLLVFYCRHKLQVL
jgi:hypothetical protein